MTKSERKRISIAFDAVTDPSLLLIDGLDTGCDVIDSRRICRMMRSEALRGMTIVTSIDEPSTETLFMFDRIFLLSHGRLIFNGPPS